METIAQIYVNVIEPAFKFMLFFFVVLCVLWLINMARNPAKQMDIAMDMFNMIIKGMVTTLMFMFNSIIYLFNMFIRGIRITFAILRDFFISKI